VGSYQKLEMTSREIDLIVYDFDGVMTNNLVYVDEHGTESVAANRSDGMGVSWLRHAGIRQIILSTEKNIVVTRRAEKLGLKVLQGVTDKAEALSRFCQAEGVDTRNTGFVGNDLNDLKVMQLVGYSVCPSDAYAEIKEIADVVLEAAGGEGVVRELAVRLLGVKKILNYL
jgi:YrbI family 3-deoxy-D-manno-octulosonate 8-phosphate phosphatase